MSNRKKARLVALIGLLLFVPGLHRFYMGDTTIGILLLLSSVVYISLVVAIIDIVRFYRMSDKEFDSKYTVGFKMKPVNLPLLLSVITPLLILIGGVGLFLKDRVMCLPLKNGCFLIKEGESILRPRGESIPKALAWSIQTLPPYILGLAGICILALIILSNNRNARS